MENKEMATKQKAGALATNQAGPQILRSDILVPYVVIAQGSSDSVKERKAQLGDIVRSTTTEKLGDPDKPINVVFLHYPKAMWIVEQKPAGKERFQFRRMEPRTAANETLPWSFWADDDGNEVPENTRGATQWRRVKSLSVFAILPQDIDASLAEMKKAEAGELPDLSKALTPVMMSFRATSYKVGKEICTFFTQAASMKVPVYKYMVSMCCKLEQNDDGSFYVWTIDRAKPKPITKEHLAVVQEWEKIVNSSNLQVHEDGGSEGYENFNENAGSTTREVKDVC